MEKNSKGILRKYIIPTIASFVLSIMLTALAYLTGTFLGLFNKDLVIDAMNKSSYYEEVNKYTLEAAIDYATPSNLDSSIFDGVFTLQHTYNEGKSYLIASLDGKKYTIETDSIKDSLRQNINKYISEQNIAADSINNEGINIFIDDVADMYSKNLSVPFLYYYNALKKIIEQIFMIMLPVIIILSTICLVIIFKSNKWLHRNLRFISYSCLAAAIMTSIIPLTLLFTKLYAKLNITPIYFSRMLARYLRASLNTYLYFSLCFFMLGCISIYITYYKRKNVLRNS